MARACTTLTHTSEQSLLRCQCQVHLPDAQPRLVVAAVGAVGAVRVAVAIAEARVAVAVAVAKGTSRAVWAVCVWSELLGELLLLGDGILNSLLLGSDELLVLLLLVLHELLALGLSLVEGLLLG